MRGSLAAAKILRTTRHPLAGRPSSERSSALDPFQALVAIIAIVTGGGVVSTIVTTIGKALRRPPPQELPGDSPQAVSVEQESTREAIAELSSRLQRLEEERDFYKDLLDSPAMRREIGPPQAEADAEKDAADAAGGS